MTLKNTLRPWLARRLTLLSWLALIAFTISQIITFWFTELFSHFLPHYTVLWAATAAVAVQQLGLNRIFQMADVFARHRGGNIKLLGGAGEAAALDDLAENFEAEQGIHVFF